MSNAVLANATALPDDRLVFCDALQPAPCPAPPEPEPTSPEVAWFRLAFNRRLLAHSVGYEIQARCGAVPLTAREQASREGFMGALTRLPPSPADELAAERLIQQLACTHCMAREKCARGRA